MRRVFLLLNALLLSLSIAAQDSGSVSGVVVSSWDGAMLPSVIVTVRGTTLASQTDSNGRYQINNVPTGDHVLRFSRPGFASAVVTDVRVLPSQTTAVNGNLRPDFFEMEEYEVTAEEFSEQTEKILFERQQSSSLMDAIGSEQFTKLNASDAGQIVSRVTGVSVVGGKYAVVRGLSDRYTRTLLNGMEVPSADPYKLSPQLDLFPSAMIDSISVTKTFTPDQPGGTGGGAINIVTKSFPERPFVKFSAGTSYNPNSNLKKNFLADPGSSTKMYALPNSPEPLKPDLFGLTTPPRAPGPAPGSEQMPRALERRAQADALAELLQSLNTANFAGVQKDTPLNSSLAASAGQTKNILGHNLGVFGGMNYRREFRALDAATVGRYAENGEGERVGVEQRGNLNTDLGASVNLGYEAWKGTTFGFNFMYAQSIDEEARHSVWEIQEGRIGDTLEQWQIHYTEREIKNYQITGSHELPGLLDSKFDWVVALADTSQNEPDQRFMNYYVSPDGVPSFGDASTPFPQYPSRYFREIGEHGFNSRGDWTVPLEFMPEESKFKTGFFSTSSQREFREQYFSYAANPTVSGFSIDDPNSFLNDPAYLTYVATRLTNIRTNYAFVRSISDNFSHPYTASLDVNAAYVMADAGIFPWLRVIAGGRIENTHLRVDAPRDGGGRIKQTDILPAAGLVFTIVTNLNLRLSYSETIARPSYREVAPVQSYLPELNITALGNTNLQMSALKSYDARVEWFPEPGDVISVGAFLKDVQKPIELISRTLGDENVTWDNRESAELMGIEFEARKSMGFISDDLKGLSLGANITLIKSTTPLSETEISNKRDTDPSADDSRPLYDQSPYIMNFDVTYEHPTWGSSITVGANLTGERIVLAKTAGPDIYEHPPISLDCVIGQKIGKNWTFRFGIRNILDAEYRQTYGKNFDGNIYQAYKRGTTYGFSFSGDF